MNVKMDSGTRPQKQESHTEQKKESIVNRLTCATLKGVNGQVIEEADIVYRIISNNMSCLLPI